ncbi:RraA family protein [Pseudoroseomonas ludipueritiae]|nr:RraA family protein [Pseudoroseomonas ludipueritiae]
MAERILERMREQLFTALLSDVLDSLGYMNQALPSRIRPLDDAASMAGRARTALYLEVYEATPGENPYDLEIDLVDSLAPGEIPVFACGHSGRIAPWGELLSTAAQVRRSAGALMDGMVRDVRAIREMGYPVFHGGIGPLDSKGRGKIVALDVPVECGGVRVCPGDFVFGDADGVVVVPQAVEAAVAEGAEAKLRGEKETLRELRAGVPLRVVFEKYGIL